MYFTVFFFYGYGDHRDLHVLAHSFPTRRSSDLTSISFGNITVRNIFGYRHNWVDQLINTGATGPLFLPYGTQFSIFHAGEQYNREYLTEEIQEIGRAHV